jgi:hypothetical protein
MAAARLTPDSGGDASHQNNLSFRTLVNAVETRRAMNSLVRNHFSSGLVAVLGHTTPWSFDVTRASPLYTNFWIVDTSEQAITFVDTITHGLRVHKGHHLFWGLAMSRRFKTDAY